MTTTFSLRFVGSESLFLFCGKILIAQRPAGLLE